MNVYIKFNFKQTFLIVKPIKKVLSVLNSA